jgi:hypothetical protein
MVLGHGGPLRLSLPNTAIRIRKNGIEFFSQTPVPCWTEMTLALHATTSRREINCSGVIVACDQKGGFGYRVSLMFTNISPQAQAFLKVVAS